MTNDNIPGSIPRDKPVYRPWRSPFATAYLVVVFLVALWAFYWLLSL